MGYDMKIALHRDCYSANAIREEARSSRPSHAGVPPIGNCDGL